MLRSDTLLNMKPEREYKRARSRFGVLLALSIAMMMVIFAFSGMDGTLSTSESDGIAFWVARQVIDGFEQMTEAQQLQALHSFTYPIRKSAHMTEYAILGALLTGTFWEAAQLRRGGALSPKMRAWALGFACAVLYACTDEFHQTFVPGRTGQPIDVCIDAIGILIGSLVTIELVSWRSRARKGRKALG